MDIINHFFTPLGYMALASLGAFLGIVILIASEPARLRAKDRRRMARHAEDMKPLADWIEYRITAAATMDLMLDYCRNERSDLAYTTICLLPEAEAIRVHNEFSTLQGELTAEDTGYWDDQPEHHVLMEQVLADHAEYNREKGV